MTKKPNAEKVARACGMTVEQWCTAKQQSQAAMNRGRGRGAIEKKLASWGDVEGQQSLFGSDGE